MITVFTPTYNRKDTLTILYNSLLRQTFKDFEWLVVDDGSNDGTDDLMKSLINENKVHLNYIKQENGGKHRAINKGLDYAKGDYFFIVDSDDYLPNDSLEIISNYINQIDDLEDIIGVVGFRAYSNGDFIGGKKLKREFIDSNLIERREKYKVTADMAKVIKTSIFKKFKFPEIENEKFVAESIVWNRMAIDYKFRYFNEAIYVGEYLENGLSNNSIRNRRKYPRYATMLYSELANNPKASLKLKIKSLINFWRFALYREESFYILLKETEPIFLSLAVFPFGYIFYLKDYFKDEVKVKKIK
ncbi:MAG: glycosyltransferase family 2 protein [Psychroflexus sp.]